MQDVYAYAMKHTSTSLVNIVWAHLALTQTFGPLLLLSRMFVVNIADFHMVVVKVVITRSKHGCMWVRAETMPYPG